MKHLFQQIESKLLIESKELEILWKDSPLLKMKQKVQPNRRQPKKNQPSLLTIDVDVIDFMLTSDS